MQTNLIFFFVFLYQSRRLVVMSRRRSQSVQKSQKLQSVRPIALDGLDGILTTLIWISKILMSVYQTRTAYWCYTSSGVRPLLTPWFSHSGLLHGLHLPCRSAEPCPSFLPLDLISLSCFTFPALLFKPCLFFFIGVILVYCQGSFHLCLNCGADENLTLLPCSIPGQILSRVVDSILVIFPLIHARRSASHELHLDV